MIDISPDFKSQCPRCETCKFQKLQWEAANFIQRGGLKQDKDTSQVHKSSWNCLREINLLGMLTFNSQDAYHNPNERAYINGFLRPGEAYAFVEEVNTHTDKVALLLLPSRSRRSSVAVTRKPSDSEDISVGEFKSETRMHLYSTKKQLDEMKALAHLPKSSSAQLVVVIDPVWGRAASSKRGLFNDVIQSLNWFDKKIGDRKV